MKVFVEIVYICSIFIITVICGGSDVSSVTVTTPRAVTFTPSGVARCTQPLDVGFPCDEFSTPVELYHFSTTEEFCEPFEYFGCGGNDNQFDSFDACDLFCSFQGHHRPLTSP
ncbi:unnamed protein product [Chironomus riparius]|uniref:BPTI/Kunitz inhibitor domain-containing protein n=1 Tax=Chironomus riparius TaxID=315576 RepID=A0A9N9S9S3_9DIPT|nr:unnamed protein product [Chironomus riparius]